MSQAGVSYQIKVLEERVGVPLFVRDGRQMALTDPGRALAARVTEAFVALDRAFGDLRTDRGAVLAITCSNTFATNILAARLGAFQIAHPEIAVRLDVSDRIVNLAEGEFDVAIRGVVAPEKDDAATFLLRQVFTPIASPDFLARHPLTTEADVLRVPRVSPEDEWWDSWLAAQGLPHEDKAGIFFDSQVLDGQAAIAGHGVAMLSPIMFADTLRKGALVQPFPDSLMTEPRSFWLVCPQTARNQPKVRRFRDWLLGVLRELAGESLDLLAPPAH